MQIQNLHQKQPNILYRKKENTLFIDVIVYQREEEFNINKNTNQ